MSTLTTAQQRKIEAIIAEHGVGFRVDWCRDGKVWIVEDVDEIHEPSPSRYRVDQDGTSTPLDSQIG